jgi:hypothetical protein
VGERRWVSPCSEGGGQRVVGKSMFTGWWAGRFCGWEGRVVVLTGDGAGGEAAGQDTHGIDVYGQDTHSIDVYTHTCARQHTHIYTQSPPPSQHTHTRRVIVIVIRM